MKLFLDAQLAELRRNARLAEEADRSALAHPPVVKLFTPDAGATWLLSELDANNILFGLCDLGLGCPELGYVSLAELEQLRGRLGLPVERDRHFKPTKTLGEYTDEAQQVGYIKA